MVVVVVVVDRTNTYMRKHPVSLSMSERDVMEDLEKLIALAKNG